MSRRMIDRVERLALETRPATVAGLVLAIAAFGVVGALEFSGAPLGLFSLDGELKPPAVFSSLLSFGSGLLALALGARRARRHWSPLGAFLLFMAADDLLTIHENLQSATGVDWQILYMPAIVVGGVFWLRALTDIRSILSRGAVLMVLGAAAWVLAQLAEAFEYDEGEMVERYAVLATAEELLEMAGSLLFALAFAVAIRHLAAIRRDQSAGAGTPGA